MARRPRPKNKKPSERPSESALAGGPEPRPISPVARRRGRIEVAAGTACLIAGIAVAMAADDEVLTFGRFVMVYAAGLLGAFAIATGAWRLDRRPGGVARADKRRWIYGGLAAGFSLVYALLMWKVIPNRLPSAMLHLATVPAFTLVMAIGTLVGGRYGWWVAVVGGSIVLLSTIVLIARILASAAFLAGVYGAFGKAASTFALVSVALLVEVVGLLPICQVRFLMSRPGRRTYGV